ncbi:MAG TPA: hypothetical protein VG839_08545 [Asticcacaulis sp.]|nr:hypothetical protein [Asticcacaulis sp.]
MDWGVVVIRVSILPTFLPALVILSAALLAILFILYRIYETRVEEPKKLEDEVKEALGGAKAEVESIEPVRKAACAISYAANKVVIVRNFGKLPTRIYAVSDLYGMEVFVDGKVFARVVRAGSNKPLDSGSYKAIDEISPDVLRVTMRLIFDDPSHPDYELVLWDPNDALTARAEGPRAALQTARKWFYHIEAVLRRPAAKDLANLPPITPAPEPAKVAAPAPAAALESPAPAPLPAPKPDGDVLNAPLIPYL